MKSYEKAWPVFESRRSPWAIFKFIRSDKSEFYEVSGYNFTTEKHVNLYFDSYEEARENMNKLPVPLGYYEKPIR